MSYIPLAHSAGARRIMLQKHIEVIAQLVKTADPQAPV